MKTQTQQPESIHAPAMSAGSVLTQVSSVLALIVILILICAWLARRMGFAPKRGSTRGLNISASVTVGQRERVVIVDTDDARLVLGVTAQQITHLHTLPPRAPQAEEPNAPVPADFRQLLQTLIKRPGKSQ